MSTTVKVLKIIMSSLSVLLIAALIAIALSRFFDIYYFSVLSGSMSPDIPAGSLVVCAPEELENIQEGDVVSYVTDKNLTVVTHRVTSIDVENGIITTRGDANEGEDPPVLSANVIGVVKHSIPYLGYPLAQLSTLSGKILTVTVLVVILLTSFLLNAFSKNTRKKQLVITYENPTDLNDEKFAEIAAAWKMKYGDGK